MGILKAHIDLFCKLKKKDPSLFKKSLLSISQNAVYATENQLKNIFKSNNLKETLVSEKFDKKNKIPDWFNTSYGNNVNAQYLFSLLGSKKIVTSDISRYENPDIILDLNKNVKKFFFNKFHNIVDMGTIEHIFNIPVLLNNYKKMLKKNGNLIIATTCSNSIDHGFYSFSPTFFFDFFDKNGFELKDCFLRESTPFNYEASSKIYKYETVGAEIPFISNKSLELFVVAKKIHNKLNFITPIQGTYFKNYYWRNKNLSIGLNYSSKDNNNTIIKKNKYYFILKKIFLKFISYLPFYFEKKIYGCIRGKNIKRVY